MGTVFDIVMLALVVLFTLLGVHRGLVRSVLGFAAALLSAWFTPTVANWAYTWIGGALKPAEDQLMTRLFCLLGAFLALLVVTNAAAQILGAVFRLPVLKQINGILGGVLGFLQGAVLVLVICVLSGLWMPVLTEQFPEIKAEELKSSKLLQLTEEQNPFLSLYEKALDSMKEMISKE